MTRDPKRPGGNRNITFVESLEDMLLYTGAARGNANGALGPDAAPVPALYAMNDLIRAGQVDAKGRPDQITMSPLIEP